MASPPLAIDKFQRGDAIFCIAYSHDGTQLAAGAYGGTIRIWDTSTAKLTHTLNTSVGEMFQGSNVSVASVRFRPDGKRVYGGLSNGKVVEWDIEKEKIEATWHHHTGVVTGIGVLKSNRPIITASADQTIVFRSPEGGDIRRYPASERLLYSMAVSDDERWLATLDLGGDVKLWDIDRLATGNVGAMGWDLLNSVAVSGDGQQIAWGGNDGFSIGNCEDLAASRTFRRAMSGGAMIHKLQFSSSGGRLLSAGMFGKMRTQSSGTPRPV